jgi:hypothetical protein
MIGLPKYLYNGQNERVEELNQRTYERNVPDIVLEPNFDPRPVPTKYSIFPIIDRKVQVDAVTYPNYNNEFTGSNAPVSGYFQHIDDETSLRNQYPLDKSDKNVYVPSSKSDMYGIPVMYDKFDAGNWQKNNIYPFLSYQQTVQPHPALFEQMVFKPHVSFDSVGNNLLNNHTRTQLRNL